MRNRVAVVYDFLQVAGGAELFSLELARRLPESQLIVAGVAHEFPDHLLPDNLAILDSRSLPVVSARRALHAMFAFRRSRRITKTFDHVILSGHFSPLLYTPDSCRHWIYYAHTTPLPFIHEDRTRTMSGAPPLVRIAQDLAGYWLERHVWHRFKLGTTVIANSRFTAAAFSKRLGVQARVIHPPCLLDGLKTGVSKGYFLSFARLEPAKRVDRIIKAFRQCPSQRLIITSNGSQYTRLRELAAGCGNIEFKRTTDARQIRALLSECRATVYLPLHEPFGVSAVESLACGKPVIAASSGGLPEIIEPGVNGWLIGEQADTASLIDAIECATEMKCIQMRTDCIDTARGYDWDNFLERIRTLIFTSDNDLVEGMT